MRPGYDFPYKCLKFECSITLQSLNEKRCHSMNFFENFTKPNFTGRPFMNMVYVWMDRMEMDCSWTWKSWTNFFHVFGVVMFFFLFCFVFFFMFHRFVLEKLLHVILPRFMKTILMTRISARGSALRCPSRLANEKLYLSKGFLSFKTFKSLKSKI